MKLSFKKIFFGLTIIFGIIVISIFIYFQFYFKNNLKSILENEGEKILNAEIHIGQIEGNVFSNFEIDNIEIKSDNNSFAHIKKINLSYDFIDFLFGNNNLNIQIIDPTFYFKKENEKLNFENLFVKKEKKEQKEISFEISGLKVLNGKIFVFDTSLSSFEKINLNLNCKIKNEKILAHIENLRFDIPNKNFSLKNFSANLNFSPKEILVDNLYLKTNNSNLKLSANLLEYDITKGFNLDSLKEKNFSLKISSEKFNLNEVGKLFYSNLKLKNNISFDADMTGKLNDIIKLDFKKFQFENSIFRFSSELKNIFDTNNFLVRFQSFKGKIFSKNFVEFFPEYNLEKFEVISFSGNLEYQNKIIKTNLSIENTNGNSNFDGEINFEENIFDTKFELSYLDILPYVNIVQTNKTFPNTNINCSGKISGNIDLSNFDLSILFYPSQIFMEKNKIEIENSVVDVKYNFPNIFSNISFVSNIASGNLIADLQLNFNEIVNIDANGQIENLNFSKIYSDKNFESNISFLFKNSYKKTSSDFNIYLEADFTSLEIEKFIFKDSLKNIPKFIYEKTNEKNHISFLSSYLDCDLNGNFTIENLVPFFPFLTNEIKKNFYTDVKTIQTNSKFDLSYIIKLKNRNMFSSLFSEENFSGKLEIEGAIQSDIEKTKIDGSGKIENLIFGKENNLLRINSQDKKNFSFEYNCGNENQFVTKLNFDDLIFGKINVTNLNLNLDINKTSGKIITEFTSNNYIFNLDGKFSNENQKYVFDFQKTSVKRKNWELKNFEPIVFEISKNNFEIKNFLLKKGSQKIEAIGKIQNKNQLNFVCNIENIDYNEFIEFFLVKDESKKKTDLFSGSITGQIFVNGQIENPIITGNIFSNNFSFKNNIGGNFLFDFNYANNKLHSTLNINSNNTLNPFYAKLEGNFPTKIYSDENINFVFITKKFPLEIFDPFIKKIDNITGSLSCSLQVAGTTKNPNYNGIVKIENGKFLFEENNLYYNISGNLIGKENHLEFSNFTISNLAKDFSDGKLLFNGKALLNGIFLDYIDINVNGKILALTQNQNPQKKFYGKLFAETDGNGISLKGKIDDANLSGKIFIVNSNLTFPPVKSTKKRNFVLNIITIDDTSKQILEKEKIKTDNQSHKILFLENLSMDLILETKGTNQIKMIFNSMTNEELMAELNGKLIITKHENDLKTIGEIEIGKNSYYNFLKRFDAFGKLKFTGESQNPELEINASYYGIHLDTLGNADKKILVQLNIFGTRIEPKISTSIKEIQNHDTINFISKNDVQSDAIAFITMNKFSDELTKGEKSQIVSNVENIMSTSIGSVTSSMLSGVLTDFVRKEFGFIRSAEITYLGSGNIGDKTNLRLSGEILNSYWTFGGRVFNNIGNANVNLQFPVGEITKLKSLKNFYIEIERKTEDNDFSNEKKTFNTARFFYKISF